MRNFSNKMGFGDIGAESKPPSDYQSKIDIKAVPQYSNSNHSDSTKGN